MCWKYEWAKASNNLSWAIRHVERARAKLHKRMLRNKKTFKKYQQSKKYNYPCFLAPVQKNIEKNLKGEKQCREIIADLKKRQAQLKNLIDNYGLSRKSDNKSTERFLRGRRKAFHEKVKV